MVCNSRKKAPNKSILFDKKFPPVGMEDSLKNVISLDVKATFGGSNV